MWIHGSSGRELGKREKNPDKKQKGKLGNIFGEPSPSAGGQVVAVQGAAA